MALELLQDKKQWDQFVENSPQGTLFHKWDLLKTVERHSEYKFLPYGAYANDQLICIFPFFKTQRWGLTYLFSPPRRTIPYLGVAYDPSVLTRTSHQRDKIFQKVTDELCSEIDKIGANSVNFKTVPNFLDVRSFAWNGYAAHVMWTYAIDLEKSLDEIWASFPRRCRQNIKRVNKHSPELQQTSDVSALLDIWQPSFRERGMEVPLLGDRYLKEVVAAFPLDMTVYSVIIDGQLAIANLYCAMQKERYAWWIGGIGARKDLAVHEYIQWEVVQQAKSDGFKKLDLLGAPNRGISEFKSKFNPVLEPYCFVEKTDRLGKVVKFAGSNLRRKQVGP